LLGNCLERGRGVVVLDPAPRPDAIFAPFACAIALIAASAAILLSGSTRAK